MLFVKEPFIPIFRCVESLPKRLMRCKCWDIERLKWLEYTFDWEVMSGDDSAELARVLLAPSTYEPTIEEFRYWVDRHSDRNRQHRR